MLCEEAWQEELLGMEEGARGRKLFFAKKFGDHQVHRMREVTKLVVDAGKVRSISFLKLILYEKRQPDIAVRNAYVLWKDESACVNMHVLVRYANVAQRML